jgi:hypothetical protein
MTPVQLYADIHLDEDVMNGKPMETKEASLAARISAKSGNGKQYRRNAGHKGRHNRAHSQSYDGYVYNGHCLFDEYVRLQKQKKGANYRECQFCTWPGHLANQCHKLRQAKAKQGSGQQ